MRISTRDGSEVDFVTMVAAGECCVVAKLALGIREEWPLSEALRGCCLAESGHSSGKSNVRERAGRPAAKVTYPAGRGGVA